MRPVLHIDSKASLTQLLTLFLEKNEIAARVGDDTSNVIRWNTMDDVMKVLMGVRHFFYTSTISNRVVA